MSKHFSNFCFCVTLFCSLYNSSLFGPVSLTALLFSGNYDPTGFFEKTTGMTWPYEMERLMKNFLGLNPATMVNTCTLNAPGGDCSTVPTMQNLVNSGKKLAMLINDGMLKGQTYSVIPTHWVQLISSSVDSANQTVTLTLYTWGNESTYTVSCSTFQNMFYGYICGEVL